MKRKYLNALIILIVFYYMVLFLIYSYFFGAPTNHDDKSKPKNLIYHERRFNNLNAYHNYTIFLSYVHQLDTKDAYSIENFRYFLHFAYAPCSNFIFYKINLNLDSIELDVKNELSKLIDQRLLDKLYSCKNTAILLKRNRGGDICRYIEAFNTENWNRIKKNFKYFFFINSSVRGPFLPNYWTRPWWDIFIEIFIKNQDVVCSGPYLSLETNPHIQSFMMAVDQRGLGIMESTFRCISEGQDRLEWILNTEVKLGQKILDSGYKLQSLLSIYNGKSDPQDYKYISKYNPFYQYPLPNQLFDSLNQLNRDYLFSLVKYWISNFLKLPGYDDSFSANVFELTWVKYNQRMANEMTNYQKYYIPFYTKIQYENNKLSNLYY